jgi:hypothetical protein
MVTARLPSQNVPIGAPLKAPASSCRNRGVGQAQAVGDLGIDVHVHQAGVAEIVVVNQLRVGTRAGFLDARADPLQFGDVVTGDAHLDGRFHGHALLQFLDDHQCLRRHAGQARRSSATRAGVSFSSLVLTMNWP